MRTAIILSFFMLLTTASFAQDEEMEAFLSDLKWKNRVIFIFTPSEASNIWGKQLKAYQEDMSAYKERDLLITLITSNTVTPVEWQPTTTPSASEFRQYFHVAPASAYTFILVGKDGGEKLREQSFVRETDLFGLIDSMPMRKQEIRQQSKN
jgi:hypothetical protein